MIHPCKHLDYDETKYGGSCELKSLDGCECQVRYWQRKFESLPYDEAPVNVQFCGQGRGRINGIFQCYTPGEMPCYEAERREDGGQDG